MNTLDLLDEMLSEGLKSLGGAFPEAQLAYVLGQQRPDGGFGGRRGASDVYYTEFGLRLLVLLDGAWGPNIEALRGVASFLQRHTSPRELVDVFSVLNARRMLAAHDIVLRVDEGTCRDEIGGRRVRGGGYGRPDGSGLTAYATFLAGLSLGLMEREVPRLGETVRAISALQQPDGGFAQEPGGTSQTNSTAAAVGFLLLEDAPPAEPGEAAAAYLVGRQDASGGFCTLEGVPADLLSTFTSFSTLVFLNAIEGVNMAQAARFVRACGAAEGGFGAHAGDPETDVEYTYYGVGTLALLAGLLA